MLVGFNAYFLQHPHTGSGQYTRHLLAALGRHERHLRVMPLLHRGAPSTDVAVRVVPPAFGSRLGDDWQKLWWEQVTWPRACRSLRVDVAHVPYFAPPWVAPPHLVVTIHDLIPLLLPEYVTSPLVRAYNALVSASARRAAAVIADSQASKRDILRVLGLSPERVHVVYLAADEAASTGESAPDEQDTVRRRFSLRDPFVLYLGGFDKRKNVEGLLRAAARLSSRPAWHLALAGALPGRPGRLFPDLPGLVERLSIQDRVRFLGRVSDEEKWALYRAAACFVYPSLYEGFGLDPLEAMTCGTPVICSNRASLPEIVGDGGLLIDPKDEAALAAAIGHVLESPDLRAELAQKAMEVASQFSWANTARQTRAVYELAMERRRP